MSTKTDPGIDYSMGLPMDNKGTIPNIDPDTSIRYGVIPVHAITQAWSDESEGYYPCEEGCENWDEENEECMDMCGCEASEWYIDDGEYKASQSADDCDIFVIKSPYFTYAQFCSPCAPGACYLLNPLDTPVKNNRAYCFGKDWFDDEEPCPYPYWSVETGELVYDPNKPELVCSTEENIKL